MGTPIYKREVVLMLKDLSRNSRIAEAQMKNAGTAAEIEIVRDFISAIEDDIKAIVHEIDFNLVR